MVTLLALESPTHIALFENSFSGEYKLKMKRRVYQAYFKGKRAKIKTFENFDPEHIHLNQIYDKPSFQLLLNTYLKHVEKEKKQEKRGVEPQSGDYLQLIQHGRLSEDFTFIHEMIADHGDGVYVVIDMYQHEYLISANPDRDNGTRKAFKQILQGEK